jgi:hypothetical protein
MDELATVEDIRSRLRDMLPELRKRYPISARGLLGSWAHGEQRAGSIRVSASAACARC